MINNRTFSVAGANGTLGGASGRTLYQNKDATFPASLNSVTAVLTTTATVGTRALAFDIKDGSGNTLWRCTSAFTQAASTTDRYQASTNISQVSSNGVISMGLPLPCIIPPLGSVVIVDTANIDANDAVSASFLMVERE